VNIDLSQYSFDAVAINVVAAWLIQNLKTSKLPGLGWISEKTPATTRLISVLAAALTAAGMAVDWTAAGATHTLTVTGISVASALTFGWNVLKNWVFQTVAYKAAFKPAANGAPVVAGKP